MLIDFCRKLQQFYLEATHIINSLESLGKPFRNGRHKEHYFERLQFYQKMLNSSPMQRRLHIPKILKDIKEFKKNKAIIEFNKSDLRVYTSLGDVGDPHIDRGLLY